MMLPDGGAVTNVMVAEESVKSTPPAFMYWPLTFTSRDVAGLGVLASVKTVFDPFTVPEGTSFSTK